MMELTMKSKSEYFRKRYVPQFPYRLLEAKMSQLFFVTFTILPSLLYWKSKYTVLKEQVLAKIAEHIASIIAVSSFFLSYASYYSTAEIIYRINLWYSPLQIHPKNDNVAQCCLFILNLIFSCIMSNVCRQLWLMDSLYI